LTNLKSKVEHGQALAGGFVMGAHFSLVLPARNSSRSARILRCDHCREELGLDIQRYCHMQFCSPACMAAYQQRLAPETKIKIHRLDILRSET
jgi:hypothetical protein